MKIKTTSVNESVDLGKFTGIFEACDGMMNVDYIRISYLKNGRYHREGGKPARVWPNGTKLWHLNGLFHREDGPVVERLDDRYEEWQLFGNFHREDGPARIWPDGSVQWWLNGEYYRYEEDWKREVEKLRKSMKVALK